MTALSNRLEPPPYAYAIDCAGAQLLVYPRIPATVVRIGGEIDASNAEVIGRALRRFALKAPLIVDASHLDYVGSAGLQVLLILTDERRHARLHCSVVGGPALHRLTRVVIDHGLPLADSVTDALQLLSNAG
jgi:anti-anti-sigma factor